MKIEFLMEGIEPTEELLLEVLSRGICSVLFTKVNGEEKTMLCTRIMEMVPLESRPKGTGREKKGIINVWDLKAEAWRSFRYDNVILVRDALDEYGAFVDEKLFGSEKE